MRVIFMEEGTHTFRLRYPYSKKTLELLTTLISAEQRKNAFDPTQAAWTFPIEYWDEVLSVMGQVYPDIKLFVVDELPEFVPFDPNAAIPSN